MEDTKIKIFFVTYGGVHANIVKYIVPSLKEKYDIKILALTLAPTIFNSAKIKYAKLKDYDILFEQKDIDKIKKEGIQLAKTEFNPNSGIEYAECIRYLGIGFLDLIEQLNNRQEAYSLFKKLGRKAFCPIRTMSKILDYEKPDLVILTADVRYEKATGLASNSLNIPVLHIHDLPEMQKLSYKADICVMNKYAYKFAIENKIGSPERIHITGQPVLEDNLHIDFEQVNTIKDKLKTYNFKKMIVYLEQVLNKDVSIIEEFLLNQAKKNPQYLYVAKLHPNQNVSSDGTYLASNFLKIRDIPLKSLLYLSDLAITKESNSGLEAALMGKPLIVVEIKDKIIMDFSKYGIAKKATSLIELERLMQDILTGNKKIAIELEKARIEFHNEENAIQNINRVIDEII